MKFRLCQSALLWVLPALALRANYGPAPLPASAVLQPPYEFVGMIHNATGGIQGSGTVVADPKIVIACAHLPFIDTTMTWSTDNLWFRAWENATFPSRSAGQPLRGYWKFANYADLAQANGNNTADTFAVDFVAFYAYENLGPGSAGFWYDGQAALLTPAAKAIVGYPSGLYSNGDPNQFLMHRTGPFPTAYAQIRDSYNLAAGVATGAGNSGGPVFVTNEAALTEADQGLRFAAVLVSGSNPGAPVDSGVVAVTAPEWDLVNESLNAAGEPPINDRWSAALNISGATATSTDNNTLATKEAGEPNHAGNAGGHSVWWRWAAPGSGTVAVNTTGSNFDTLLAVYAGSGVGALSLVASDDDGGGSGTSALSFSAVAGTEYWIAVDGKNGATGTVTLNLTFSPPAPPNDAFANATPITGLSAQVLGYNINATKEPGEPNHANDAGGKSVWWKWVAPATGQVFLTTGGTKFDTLLAVYTGSSVTALSLVASNDDPPGTFNDSSTLTFSAAGGTTYWIAVDGFVAQSGAIALSLNLTPIVPVIVVQPVGQTVDLGASVALSVVARGTDPLTYQWTKDGANISGATNAVYRINAVQAADVGSYAVVVSDGADSVTSSAAMVLQNAAPVITSQPVSQSVAAGSDVTFSVTATGSPAPTLQWQVSADSGGSWSDVPDTSPYSGVTTGALTITGATAAMNGYQYRGVATNSVSSATSAVVVLTVIPARPPYFDAAAYLAHNPDLQVALGSLPDWADQAWKNYWLSGLAAGRSDGDFDPAAYLAMYPDLQAAFGNDLHAAALHWYTYGRAEGRRIPAGFDARGYLERYPDLAATYGNDLYGAWLHYLNHGVFEGRVFDTKFRAGEYPLLYGDLAALVGDPRGALLHWLNFGRAEGRMGRVPAGFDVAGYLSRYPDLAAAFGSLPYPQQPVAVWEHYVNYGINEGRTDGDFDPEAYLTMYGDLRAAFGDNWTLATLHWYKYGRYEGRRIPAGFDARGYLGRYEDLRLALGDDLYGAWLHYLDWGVNEGRVYDELFRPDEYLAMYADLRAAFGSDRQKALLHWLYYGQYEGRLGRFPLGP